jgi:uncharacterized protein YndB with AHSA1/START domain
MNSDHVITRTLILHAKQDEIWDALTNPEKIKRYMFNYDVTSEWIKGSPITWTGKRKGVDVIEKGSIIVFEKNNQFKYSMLDMTSGLEDTPDNYLYITFDLLKKYDQTELALTIENFNEDNRRCSHIAKGWDNTVLPGIRKMFNL